MELGFENIQKISTGTNPNVIQFPDSSAELFNLTSGDLYGEPINKLNGDYSSPFLESGNNVAPDSNISYVSIATLGGFGAIGSYKVGDKHKLLIYEFAIAMDPYLVSGSIKHNINNPIAQFNVAFSNPIDEEDPEGNQVAISEYEALVSPGAKITFNFSAGDSEPYKLGTFYVDRSSFSVLDETASADGRNSIGKLLKDQTLDEGSDIPFSDLSTVLKNLLETAKVSSDYYLVENTILSNGFTFSPKSTFFSAIKEILKITIDWKMQELVDGTIVIGSPEYAGFDANSVYTFTRGTDVFSRKITRDDQSAYRRVCVHDSDWNIKVFEDVVSYSGWNLQANKTLYVDVPKGTSQADADLYALELANRLGNVGKIESFVGPFRPHLTCGDEAVIVDDNGNTSLGLITEVKHDFGTNGFFTQFYVDSGGRLGQERFSDYINMFNQAASLGDVSYE